MNFLVCNIVAKTQIPSVPDSKFEEFTIPPLSEFVDGDQNEMLLCPVRALKRYFSRTKSYCASCFCVFISMTATTEQKGETDNFLNLLSPYRKDFPSAYQHAQVLQLIFVLNNSMVGPKLVILPVVWGIILAISNKKCLERQCQK